MKKAKVFLITFGIISACGLFTGLAGGVEWGTDSFGLIAGGTLAAALIFGAAASDWS